MQAVRKHPNPAIRAEIDSFKDVPIDGSCGLNVALFLSKVLIVMLCYLHS